MSMMTVVTVLVMTECAFASEAQTAPSPARVALEQMSQAERKNSCISVEFESLDGQAIALGREVERLWNGGQYDVAMAPLGNLEARVGHVAIGNSWRKPVPTIETDFWGSDIRIGSRDSLRGLSFTRGPMIGSLFVVLLHGDGPAYYSVCMSVDGGATWAETFTWVGSPVTSLDAGILGDLYVAYYSPGENAQQVRLRRFQRSDGTAVEFRTGDMWVAACTLDVGDTLREISFVSSGATSLFISTLVSDGSVLLSMSDEAAVAWTSVPTGITSGASRGLDAAYNLGGSGSAFFLLSYLDATDTLRIYGRRFTGGLTQRLVLFCGTSQLTSISGSRDAVICAYEDASTSPQRVRYASSSDGGDTWTTGTLSDTGIAAGAPAVLVSYWGRSGAVFRHCTPTCELRFCQQTDSGPWSNPVSIADNEPYWNRPGIEYLGGVVFGVVYLSDTSPVVRGAYFVRSDWPYGLAEQRRLQASSRASPATVVRSVLFLPGLGTRSVSSERNSVMSRATLLDISGREVLDLGPGANDVSKLAPGVYFVVTPLPFSSFLEGERAGVRRCPASVTKVVVTR